MCTLRSIPVFAALLFILAACNSSTSTNNQMEKKEAAVLVDGHPDWIMQGNIYEVNVRQYTPEGTFNAFAANLPRLKEMGVQTLWFMPVNPISKVERKGALGSYYAVSDYYGINPEFGNMDDFKSLVKKAKTMGFKVIIDWVPNHTGADHYWLKEHPDFYVTDSSGKAMSQFDWTDTRKLNYKNTVMQDSMIRCMEYWLKETEIDGFRVDVAWGLPDEFWKKCIPALQKIHPGLFMLAEADGPQYHSDGFDATYPWTIFHMMVKIAAGERPAFALDSVINTMDTTFPANALRLYFTSNHDENSWNKADYATMPGPVHAPFAVLTQTLARSVPLIYSGQEEPFLDSVSFFYKDTILFSKYKRAPFYKTLLELRKSTPALAANASSRKVVVGNEKALYAFVREAGDKKVLVIVNLSPKEQAITIKDKSLFGNPVNLFMGTKEPVSDKPWNIEPWGYVIYTY